MDIFAKVLQGPYAYLLILQVLIVSGLLLTLIYLVVLRLREAPIAFIEEKAPSVDDGASASAPVETPALAAPAVVLAASPPTAAAPESLVTPIVAPAAEPLIPTLPTPPVTPEAAPPAPEPVIDPAALAADQERASALEGEAAAMRDKVRYLESKLLEYEILQEEIGALSTLKVENERLRQELMQSKSRGGPPLPTPPVETAPPPPAPPPVDSESIASAAAKDAATAAADLVNQMAATPFPRPEPDLPDLVDDGSRSVLDELMTEIETVTDKQSNKSP